MLNTIKKVIGKVYTIALMCFVLWYAFFITPLMLGHNERREELLKESKETHGTEIEKDFNKLLKEQGQTETLDLGTKVMDQMYIKGHFHQIGFKPEYDTHSLCVKCHGDIPHDKVKPIRAFLNMHAFYLACETCHIKPQEGKESWTFKWYDKKTGKVTTDPVDLKSGHIDRYGNYGAKIAPGFTENGQFRFINTEKERAFVDEYLKNKEKLAPSQQTRMKKAIHKMKSEKPVFCDGCHTTETPYLPFEKLGYLSHRVNDLTNTEVVGIVSKYKAFYMPKFLLPGGTTEAGIPLPSFDDKSETQKQ